MLKVSVVIPLYNKEKHIGRAMRSVLGQSFPDFELIVVDDGSCDGSYCVAKTIKDTRIRLVRQHNSGESCARNKGISLAKADLVAFLDADDEWKPGFLETILKLQIKHPHAGAFATNYEICDGNILKPAYLPDFVLPQKCEGIIQNYFRIAFYCSPICSSAVAIPKKVFSQVGGFPPGEILGGDLDMWLRIAVKYPIAVNTDIGAVYYKDATNRVDVGKLFPLEYRLIKSGSDALLCKQLSASREVYLKKYINKFQLKSAAHCVRVGQRKRARVILGNCKTMSISLLRQKIWWVFWAYAPVVLLSLSLRIKGALTGVLNSYYKAKENSVLRRQQWYPGNF